MILSGKLGPGAQPGWMPVPLVVHRNREDVGVVTEGLRAHSPGGGMWKMAFPGSVKTRNAEQSVTQN